MRIASGASTRQDTLAQDGLPRLKKNPASKNFGSPLAKPFMPRCLLGLSRDIGCPSCPKVFKGACYPTPQGRYSPDLILFLEAAPTNRDRPFRDVVRDRFLGRLGAAFYPLFAKCTWRLAPT